MKTPLYREALSHGWQLAWRHKLLWLFGFFAAFLGQMGIFEFLAKGFFGTRAAGLGSTSVSLFSSLVGSVEGVARGELSLSLGGWVWLAWVLVFLFAVVLVVVFVGVSSQGTIIQASAQANGGKKIDIDKAWYSGTSHFWRLLCINIIKFLLLGLSSLAISWSAFNASLQINNSNTGLFFVTFLVASLVGIVTSFLVIYAAGYVVVEEFSVWKAIKSAWRLFTSHWLVSIEIGLIFFVFNILILFLAFFGLLVFFFPAVLLWLFAIAVSSGLVYALGFILASSLFILFLSFVGSVFTVFSTATWTYLFMHMHKVGLKSRIMHWMGK